VVLVDTSTWIRHFRSGDPKLVGLLLDERVVSCDVVLGELLLGSGWPADADPLLRRLPSLPSPSASETRSYVERHRSSFRGAGIGWADAQVVVAAVKAGALLYSSDDALRRVWRALGFREA
jgi:predicted nucleic acid-binding protein